MSRKDPGPKRAEGRFAYDGLERVIHEKARLSVLSSLAATPTDCCSRNSKRSAR